jgi:hypothetical protein
MKCPNCQTQLTAYTTLSLTDPRTPAPHSRAAAHLTLERFLLALDLGVMDFAGGPHGPTNPRTPIRFNPKLAPGQVLLPFRPKRDFVYGVYTRWHYENEPTKPMSRGVFYAGLERFGITTLKTADQRFLCGLSTLGAA